MVSLAAGASGLAINARPKMAVARSTASATFRVNGRSQRAAVTRRGVVVQVRCSPGPNSVDHRKNGGQGNPLTASICRAQAVATPPKPILPAPSMNGNGNGNGGLNGMVLADKAAAAPIPDAMVETQARLIKLAEASFPITEATPLGRARQELEKDEFGRVKALSTFQVRSLDMQVAPPAMPAHAHGLALAVLPFTSFVCWQLAHLAPFVPGQRAFDVTACVTAANTRHQTFCLSARSRSGPSFSRSSSSVSRSASKSPTWASTPRPPARCAPF